MVSIYGGRPNRLWPHLVRLIRSARSENKKCVLIVPGDFTLQAERALIRDLDCKGFFDIEVYSLSRLTGQILSSRPLFGRKAIDENGKNVAVARAVLDRKKELRYYARMQESMGFVQRCGSWIADMKLAQISPERLKQYVDQMQDGAEKEKLSDLNGIFETYTAILSDKFADNEDILTAAIDALPVSGILNGTETILYGFDRLNEDYIRFLCAAAPLASHVAVYLAMDREDAPDGDCFETVRQSAENLRLRLRNQHQQREWLWIDEETEDNSPAELRWLRAHLLQPGAKSWPEQCDAVTLFQASVPYVEAQYLTESVFALLEKGVNPEKIVILCGHLDIMEPLLSALFAGCGIPAYFDVQAPLIRHGLARMLLAACRAVNDGYRTEDMLELIKSGYVPLTQQESWLLENYILKYGVAGAKWKKSFDSDGADGQVETIRVKLMDILDVLRDELKNARTGAKSLTALVHLMTNAQVPERLAEVQEQLTNAGLEAAAVQNRQVWETITGVLEQMNEIAGEERIPAGVITTWLEAGLMGAKLSALPPVSGCVTVGDIGRMIPFEPEHVFLCGLSDEAGADRVNLMSEETAEEMAEKMQVTIGESLKDADSMDELTRWKLVCSAKKHLYLSYPQASQDGAAARCDRFVQTVTRLLPQMQKDGSLSESPLHAVSPLIALDEIGVRLREGTLKGEWLKAWNWLLMDEKYREIAEKLLVNAQGRQKTEQLSEERAGKLFRDKKMSISRLETFAGCPYRHFVQYGLKPKEREVWGFSPIDKGNFYHAAIEGFTKALAKEPAWPKITRKTCDQLMERALEPLVEQWRGGFLEGSARARTEGERYIRLCKRLGWVFTRGAQYSSFKLCGSEIDFGTEGSRMEALTLELTDGSKVLLEGRIDRAEEYVNEDKRYIRVVDYKSGHKELKPEQIHIGMQLQLLLYLKAMLNDDPSAVPAGAFYQWMGDPLDKPDSDKDADVRLVEALKLRGVVLADQETVRAMDDEDNPASMEKMLKKDGAAFANKLALRLEQMDALIGKACTTAAKLTEELRKGKIAAAPVRTDDTHCVCDYCAYDGICRRDKSDRSRERKLKKMTTEALLQTEEQPGTDPF